MLYDAESVVFISTRGRDGRENGLLNAVLQQLHLIKVCTSRVVLLEVSSVCVIRTCQEYIEYGFIE